MRRKPLYCSAIVCLLVLVTRTVYAVEPVETASIPGPSDRWAVVGVITGSGNDGIAVLKNITSGRTFTIEVGEALPTDYGLTLYSIQNRKVLLSDGNTLYPLNPAESVSEDVELPSRTARFLDNYYRGLNDVPIDIFVDGDAEPVELRHENSIGSIPLTTFGRLKSDMSRSRFDLYRSERRYDGPEESEIIINYDNFEDDSTGEASASVSSSFEPIPKEDGFDGTDSDADVESARRESDGDRNHRYGGNMSNFGRPSNPVQMRNSQDFTPPFEPESE